jgi:hypothetical protein
MRLNSRTLILVFSVIFLVSAVIWWTTRSDDKTSEFLTAPVVSAEIINSVSTTGTIVDQYTYDLDTSGLLLLKQIAGVSTLSTAIPIDPQDEWITAKIVKREGSNLTRGQTILTLKNYDGTTRNITAPQKGQVLSISTLEGLPVAGDVAYFGAGRILVSVSVTESELNKFIPNQPAAIAVNSSDETSYGSVIFISPVADSAFSTTPSYQVLIQVAPGVFPDGIKTGMSATVEFPIAEDDNVRYTDAKFIYEYEFSLNVDNEVGLVKKNGQNVNAITSVVTNTDSWTVETLNVQIGSFVNQGDVLATLKNFDGSIKSIKAPEAGYIRDIYTAPKALIAGSILEFGVGPILAAVDVSEFDIGQVEVGQRAVFTTNDQSGEINAEVVAISAKATVDSSAVAKFKVYLAPIDSNKVLRIGSSVRANIILESTQASFAIPVQALKEIDGRPSVEVLGPNATAVVREVSVGVIGDQLVEIKSGLTLEDQVIIGTRAPSEILPTQETGPFGEGGNDSNRNDQEFAE